MQDIYSVENLIQTPLDTLSIERNSMAKQKIDKNYLDYIPVKNPEIKYETNDKGTITVFIRWEGFFNKIAQKFFHRPKISSIDLDDYGSFVWNAIDDKKDIYTLSQELDAHFPKMEKSLSRLIKFLEILKDHHLITYSEKQNQKNNQKN